MSHSIVAAAPSVNASAAEAAAKEELVLLRVKKEVRDPRTLEVLQKAQKEDLAGLNALLGKEGEEWSRLCREAGIQSPSARAQWARVDLLMKLVGLQEKWAAEADKVRAWEAAAKEETGLRRQRLQEALNAAHNAASDAALLSMEVSRHDWTTTATEFGLDTTECHRHAFVTLVAGRHMRALVNYCHRSSANGGTNVEGFGSLHIGGGRFVSIQLDDIWGVQLISWKWEIVLPNREEILARPMPKGHEDAMDV